MQVRVAWHQQMENSLYKKKKKKERKKRTKKIEEGQVQYEAAWQTSIGGVLFLFWQTEALTNEAVACPMRPLTKLLMFRSLT